MNASQALYPIQHQRMIDRLSKQLSAVYSDKHNSEILRRIEWHTQEYLAKTGKLPQ